MFTNSGRSRTGYADAGRPSKPFSTGLPTLSEDPADWVRLRRFMHERGIRYEVARVSAWYPSRDAGDNHLRVVIPGTSRNVNNHFWQARLIEEIRQESHCFGEASSGEHGADPSWFHAPGCRLSTRTPKRYQSPHASRGDAIVITLPEGRDTGSVLVEGPFDALAASELGFVGVALMGNTPSEEVLEHAAHWLRNYPQALACMDLDAVPLGMQLVQNLLLHYDLPSLHVLSPYPYKDLAEMPLKERHALLLGRTPLPCSDGGYVEDMR